jgi:hypothetical protein
LSQPAEPLLEPEPPLETRAVWDDERSEWRYYAGGRELAPNEPGHPGYGSDFDPYPAGPTPAEEAEDLEALKALSERRKTNQSLLVQSWFRLPKQTRMLLWAAGAVTPPQAEAAFNAELEQDVARREAQMQALRLRGLLRVRAPRPAGRERPRERRTAPSRRRSSTGTSLAGKDPPAEDPEADLAPPGAAGPVCVEAR